MTALSVLVVKCTLVKRAKSNQSPLAWLMVKLSADHGCTLSWLNGTTAAASGRQGGAHRCATVSLQSPRPGNNHLSIQTIEHSDWGQAAADGMASSWPEMRYFRVQMHRNKGYISTTPFRHRWNWPTTHTHTRGISTPVLPKRLGRRPAVWLWPWTLTRPDIPTLEGGQTHWGCTLNPGAAATCAAPNRHPVGQRQLCWCPGELHWFSGSTRCCVRRLGWWGDCRTAGCFVKVEIYTWGLEVGVVSEREVMRCGESRRVPSGQREDNDDSSLLWGM